MIMNRIATKTTEFDLLEAQTREVRPSRGDPQLLKHEVESLWARAAELEASEKTTRRPPPASAQPVRSALKGSAPEARRKATHHVGIAAPGQANEGEPSSADGGPSTAAAPDAPAEAATDRPAPLYSRGMLLAKRSGATASGASQRRLFGSTLASLHRATSTTSRGRTRPTGPRSLAFHASRRRLCIRRTTRFHGGGAAAPHDRAPHGVGGRAPYGSSEELALTTTCSRRVRRDEHTDRLSEPSPAAAPLSPGEASK